VSALPRDETSTLRHRSSGCLACGADLHRAGTGRRRRYCGGACRQRAWRLRDEERRQRDAAGPEADPRDVTRLLAAVLRTSRGR
jgi:hypothetical protein